MKNLSLWSRQNRVKSITILVILHFILWWIYYFTGAYLYIQNIVLPADLKYVGAVLFFAAVACYPIKNINQGFFRNTYARRKFWQCVAITSVAVFTILFGNHSAKNLLRTNQTVDFSAQTIALDIKKDRHTSKKLKRKERRKARKALRKEIRKTLRKMRRAKGEYSEWQKFGIVMLTIIVALILLYMLLALSCSIACSGSEAFAFIVFLGGLALIIYGIIKIFRKFKIMKPKPANNGGG